MTTWTLTSHTRDKTRTIIGAAEDPEHAQRLLIAATQAMIERAAEHSRPRYTLHIDGQLTAIVQTGDDDLGLPDHAGAAHCSSDCATPETRSSANHLTTAAARHLPLAAALCGRGRPAVSSRALVCALAGAECPPAAGIGLRARSPINRSAGRPV